MAEFRPKNRGLERVLGTGALFATAYGNVGSSIYYALGLVAIYAAGMTPVVFVIAGLIFAATAATYAEATTMFPEAGGSSSFARRAFNEFWSFFAAWSQMLTYIITIAISAFFVPHYLGVFWEPLSESPGDIIGGIVVVGLLGLLNIVGVKESAGVNIGFAIADFMTQVLLVAIGIVLVLDPDLLVRQVDFGTTPTVGDFLIAIPVAMVAYTGIETISNMAEEARDVGKTIPRGIGLVVGAVAVIYAFLPAVALSAMPVKDGQTILALPKEEGGYADDPVLGRGGEHGPRRAGGRRRGVRGPAGGHDPVHRHERGAAGRVAAELLDGPAPPAAGAAARAAPALPHALRGDHAVRADRLRGDPAGAGRLPRRDLRLRRDDVLHDRPRVADHAEDQATRRGAAVALARNAARGGLRAAGARHLRRARHGHRPDRRHRARPARVRVRASPGWRWGSPSTWSTGAARASRSRRRTRS